VHGLAGPHPPAVTISLVTWLDEEQLHLRGEFLRGFSGLRVSLFDKLINLSYSFKSVTVFIRAFVLHCFVMQMNNQSIFKVILHKLYITLFHHYYHRMRR